MANRSLSKNFFYWARNIRARQMFKALRSYCRGEVLDVGGGDFFSIVARQEVTFTRWHTLERRFPSEGIVESDRFCWVVGDGCRIPFQDRSFDTVLSIQVIEHVFNPLQMVKEMERVMKKDAYGIFLIPQTSIIHELPWHYYNFTKFWIEEAMRQTGLEMVLLKPLGGFWSTIASRLIYFFFQSVKVGGVSSSEYQRNFWFYLLYPLMVVYAVLSLPIVLFLSLGDLHEEPNNHLVVVRKINS